MLEVKKTADGSYTLYNPELDEHYHSVHGARAESKHVFLKAGLEAVKGKSLQVFEMGFGTGLNAFLAAKWAEAKKVQVTYHAVERYPLEEEVWQKLQYTNEAEQALVRELHKADWEKEVVISPFFTLMKRAGDLRSIPLPFGRYHVVFFDAFGPEKQPELWTQEIFEKLWMAIAFGGTLVTYSAKGTVRRALLGADFQVERLPGPPGKREMLRAWK
ncbi:MAG: tRNA (5-methylaminomethyl-2-thiouridine)(34)-methyltransferase MnmD [Bacteroidales bacterium]